MTAEQFNAQSLDAKVKTMRAAVYCLQKQQSLEDQQQALRKMLSDSKEKCERIRNNPGKHRLFVTGVVLLLAGLIWRILLMAAIIVFIGRFIWVQKHQAEWDDLADRTYRQDAQKIKEANSKVEAEKSELIPYIQAMQDFIPSKYFSLKGVQGLLMEFQKGASSMYEATRGYEEELLREEQREHNRWMEQEAAAQTELARQNLQANTATATHTGQAAADIKGVRSDLRELNNTAKSIDGNTARAAYAADQTARAASSSARSQSRTAAAAERSAAADEAAAMEAYYTNSRLDDFLM